MKLCKCCAFISLILIVGVGTAGYIYRKEIEDYYNKWSKFVAKNIYRVRNGYKFHKIIQFSFVLRKIFIYLYQIVLKFLNKKKRKSKGQVYVIKRFLFDSAGFFFFVNQMRFCETNIFVFK